MQITLKYVLLQHFLNLNFPSKSYRYLYTTNTDTNMLFVCYAINAIITKIMKAYLKKHALEVTHLTHAFGKAHTRTHIH